MKQRQRVLKSEKRGSRSFHNVLAFLVVMGFFVICAMVITVVSASSTQIEAAAAGILGAILGYWANNLTQVVSYYYGASSPLQPSDAGVSAVVKTTEKIE